MMAISSSLVLPVISSTWMPRSLKIAAALGSILSLMRTLGWVISIFLVSCHSRESGNPVWGRPTHALGPRFRGDDDKMLRREGFVGPVEPWPERCDIGGVDRRAAPDAKARPRVAIARDVEGGSEEHTSELQSLMRNSYADFCLKKKQNT